ncbi:kinesin family member 3C isoform 2-T2 [Cochliomyia hominivorax]
MVSYLEIYNENIRDLLNPYEDLNANHALKEQHGVGVTVPTLSTHTVVNAEECYNLLNMGNRNRVVGATLMNANSSRSHSIFTISLEQIPIEEDSVEKISVAGGIRRGKLNLVDLAGSERQNKTGAVGERLREATKINLSLSALGNVISALVDGKTKHIPYRDSKLTRLLQDSLGGNTKTLMIACISPAHTNYDETISTLRYASRAKNIFNKPKINEDPKDAKLREYQEEIIKLKKMLEANNVSEISPNSSNQITGEANRPPQTTLAWLDEESQKIKSEMQAEMERLRDEHIREKREKEQRIQEMEELKQNYEEQLTRLKLQSTNHEESPGNKSAEQQSTHGNKILQLEACKRIEMIKQALIGGERANDIQLKERRQKKKLDAQRRLSALAHVLSRVEQSEDRDILQGHYTSIQQELNAKNEHLKLLRQKCRALEREVSDLQVEFQLDRADYLETIRRLEKNLKFYQQIMEKALPILRKDGKYWNPDEILQNSEWNDELKVWKLPESSMNVFKLPLASSLRNNIYIDNVSQKRINSPSSLQNTFNNFTFVPVDYFKETSKTNKYVSSKNNTTHSSANSSTNGTADDGEFDDKEKLLHKSNNNLNNRTIYSLQNYDHLDLDKSEILQNYFRSNRRRHTAEIRK